jgi:long-chain acyl-CoA synthetase
MMDARTPVSQTPWRYMGRDLSQRLIDCTTIAAALARLDSGGLAGRPALTWYEGGKRIRHWSYAELLTELRHIATVLRIRYRINKGDRILVMSGNCPEAYLAYLAILSLGAVAVPISNQESNRAIDYIASQVDPALMIVGRGITSCPSLSRDQPIVTTASLQADAARGGDDAFRSPSIDTPRPDDLAVILFTSGTTAAPKGVCLSHYNLLVNAEGLRRAHNLAVNQNHLCILPLFHANAFGFSMIGSIYSGCHVVLCDEFPGGAIWRIIRDERVDILSAVPEIIRILGARRLTPSVGAALKYVVSAAAPLTRSTALKFIQNTNVRIRQGYGLSECTNFAATVPANIRDASLARLLSEWPVPSIGSAVFGAEVQIGRAAGGHAAEGEEGEVLVAGHSVMLRYWRSTGETQTAFRDGWLHSGDLGFYVEIDGARYFFITGRLKEIIVRYGEKVAPRAVEEEIRQLNEIGRFAACGFPNEAAGEEIGVYIACPWSSQIEHQVRNVLSACPIRYRPRVAVVGEEPIPTTVTGKVKRSLLVRYFAPFGQTAFGTRPRIVSAW